LPDQSSPNEQRETFEKNKKRAVSGAKSYAKYSGMAIQMVVILLLFVYGGKWLDGYFDTGKPYFTLGFSLLGIALALYVPLRNLMK
jgi:ATP synthase protein I